MKTILITIALIFSNVLCIGIKPQGGKVQLEERRGKTYLVHYSADGLERNINETDMTTEGFASWCTTNHYSTSCR